ncbi:hypothetical protein AB0J86_05195 [Micromonospora sp. NPDC049559]|uniref:hypothetical protein n=1 Tax=Micromonospora sp. NPDC049559 TaxID=3155923 RepID=UPI00343CE227
MSSFAGACLNAFTITALICSSVMFAAAPVVTRPVSQNLQPTPREPARHLVTVRGQGPRRHRLILAVGIHAATITSTSGLHI